VTFTRRVVTGTVIVLLASLGTLVWSADRAVRRSVSDDVALVLEREARLIAAALAGDSAAWQETARRYSGATGNRVTIVGRDGAVLADSDFPGSAPPALENHRARPEIRSALSGRTGRAVRHSASVGRDLMYVAVPAPVGAVRVAEDLSRVGTMSRSVFRSVIVSAILALLVGTVLAAIAARSIGQPLTALAAAARAIAGGSPPRFPRSGVSELDSLVRALREMHQQLATRFEELRREKAESAALVESMVEGVIAADGRGRITTANVAARRLLGYGAEQPMPPLGELFRSRAGRDLVQLALHGDSAHSKSIEIEDRTLLVTARGLPGAGAVLVLHDLTDMRRLETMRRDFVANVSHELRTPLTSICGYAETLLGESTDSATARRFLEIILANGHRMQRLVDDLLDLSRIESGRWSPAPAPVDAASLAREAWASLAGRTRTREIGFDVESPEGTIVTADADALRQVVTNLLDNAVRYTPAGGRITCRIVPNGTGTTLSVSDTGTGISREHLPRIFERFYRADRSRSREEGGTGLGLAIVKHLVEAHGGRVTAESELGRGTTVSCWFPAA
jgi:two-component system phosphate regulon sensor histidine kinase PhoR